MLKESERYVRRGKDYLDYRLFLLRYGNYEECMRLEEKMGNGREPRADLVEILGNEQVVKQYHKYYEAYRKQSKSQIPKITLDSLDERQYQNPVYVQSLPKEIQKMKQHTMIPSSFQTLAKQDLQRKEMQTADLLINNRYFPSDYERVVYELTIIKESNGRIEVTKRSGEFEGI